MPTHHGIYRKTKGLAPSTPITPEQTSVFRCGIMGVFDALTTNQEFQADNLRAFQIAHHFNGLCHRLVFSAQELNQLMQEMSRLFTRHLLTHPEELGAVQFRAGVLADHVFSYLGTLVDDIALCVTLVTGYAGPKKSGPIDSMGLLMKETKAPALAPVADLLNELELPGSWWERAFGRKVGRRQLLVHNQHLIEFQASGPSGGPMVANAFFHLASGRVVQNNFFDNLRITLLGFCEWLDQLEPALSAHLKTRDPNWQPSHRTYGVGLPVGNPTGVTVLDPFYFPLPLCDDADELPWLCECAPSP